MRMIRPFTQNSLIYNWTEDRGRNNSDEIILDAECLSPSEETIAFLKKIARTYPTDKKREANRAIPTA
jgi:hypothetical protein